MRMLDFSGRDEESDSERKSRERKEEAAKRDNQTNRKAKLVNFSKIAACIERMEDHIDQLMQSFEQKVLQPLLDESKASRKGRNINQLIKKTGKVVRVMRSIASVLHNAVNMILLLQKHWIPPYYDDKPIKEEDILASIRHSIRRRELKPSDLFDASGAVIDDWAKV